MSSARQQSQINGLFVNEVESHLFGFRGVPQLTLGISPGRSRLASGFSTTQCFSETANMIVLVTAVEDRIQQIR